MNVLTDKYLSKLESLLLKKILGRWAGLLIFTSGPAWPGPGRAGGPGPGRAGQIFIPGYNYELLAGLTIPSGP